MSEQPGSAQFVEVRMLRLPVDVWQRAQEHVDGLLREFVLIAQDDEARAATPGKLLDLIEHLNAGYGEFSDEQRRRMEAAAERGELEIDLTYVVPPAAGGAAQQLGDMLDEADDYCRRGDHLLTLATPEEALRFRKWFISEFVAQVNGQRPTPWPDYAEGA